MAATSVRRDTQETRKRLIDAAEKLFAEKGIDNVSLADINRAAQQKNRNALQYHFGDRETLVNAVLDKHRQAIAAQRRAMLDELEAGDDHTLRDVIEVLVLPVSKLLNKASGVAFLKINSQLMTAEGYAEMRRLSVTRVPEAKRMNRLMADQFKNVGKEQLAARLLLIECLLFQGLATYVSRETGVRQRVFVDTLVDSMVALLVFPASDQDRANTPS